MDAALVSGKTIYRNPELVTALNLWVDGQEVDYTAWEKGGSSPVFTRKESTSAAYGVTLDTKGLEHGSIDLAADGSSVELTKVDGRTCTFTMVRQAVAVAAVFTASKTTSTDGTLKPGTNTVTYRQGMGTGQGVISGPTGGLVVGGTMDRSITATRTLRIRRLEKRADRTREIGQQKDLAPLQPDAGKAGQIDL